MFTDDFVKYFVEMSLWNGSLELNFEIKVYSYFYMFYTVNVLR